MKYISPQTHHFCIRGFLYNLMQRDISKIILIHFLFRSDFKVIECSLFWKSRGYIFFNLQSFRVLIRKMYFFKKNCLFLLYEFLPLEMAKTKTKQNKKLEWAIEKLKRKSSTVEQKRTRANVSMNFNLHLGLLFVDLLRNMVLENQL